jgi:hypothetical protein
MKFSGSVFRSLTFVMIIFALPALGTTTSAQTQMQVPPPQTAPQAAPATVAAQAPSICGNQPFCYETADFAAVVTDFRTSKSGYFGLIATTIRFVNKTSNPLVLGYANGSGTAQDDSGLRYGVGGANGVRGMGLVNGPYVDPKFVLQPGGFGDARFELAARLTPVYGITFELNLTLNEINTLEGNQHTVGAEFPLQFQGLTNGARGTAPGAVIPGANSAMPTDAAPGQIFSAAGVVGQAAPACGPASTATALASATNSAAAQNAAGTANTAMSNATAALSSLGSIFGKKKQAAAAPAQAATAAAAPCVPGANGTPGAVSNAAGTVAGAAPQGKGGASSVAAIASGVAGAANAASGAGAPAGVTPAGVAAATATKVAAGTAAATAPPTVAAPPASTAKAKAQPAKPAVKKGAAPAPEQRKTAETEDKPKPVQQP